MLTLIILNLNDNNVIKLPNVEKTNKRWKTNKSNDSF